MTANKKTHEKHPYTKFYLTMLILSTVGTSFGVLGFIGIPQLASDFSLSVSYGIFSVLSYINTLIAVVALVLLWRQNIAGLWLKLSTYVASILITIGLYLTSGPIIDAAVTQAKEEAAKSSQPIDGSFLSAFVTATFTVALIFTIIASVVFGLLWWFAWKRQIRSYDE